MTVVVNWKFKVELKFGSIFLQEYFEFYQWKVMNS